MRRKHFVWGMALLVLFFLGACMHSGQIPKDPYATSAYRTLSMSLSARDLMYGYVSGLHDSKLITEESWAAFDALDTKFLKEHIKASEIMSKYMRGEISLDDAESVMKLVDKALQELKDYYLKKIPAGELKPLI